MIYNKFYADIFSTWDMFWVGSVVRSQTELKQCNRMVAQWYKMNFCPQFCWKNQCSVKSGIIVTQKPRVHSIYTDTQLRNPQQWYLLPKIWPSGGNKINNRQWDFFPDCFCFRTELMNKLRQLFCYKLFTTIGCNWRKCLLYISERWNRSIRFVCEIEKIFQLVISLTMTLRTWTTTYSKGRTDGQKWVDSFQSLLFTITNIFIMQFLRHISSFLTCYIWNE